MYDEDVFSELVCLDSFAYAVRILLQWKRMVVWFVGMSFLSIRASYQDFQTCLSNSFLKPSKHQQTPWIVSKLQSKPPFLRKTLHLLLLERPLLFCPSLSTDLLEIGQEPQKFLPKINVHLNFYLSIISRLNEINKYIALHSWLI